MIVYRLKLGMVEHAERLRQEAHKFKLCLKILKSAGDVAPCKGPGFSTRKRGQAEGEYTRENERYLFFFKKQPPPQKKKKLFFAI